MTDNCKGSLIRWLMEESNPSVRYFTLRDLLGRGEYDPLLQAARLSIPTSKIVRKIFSMQKPGGYWGNAINPYHPKYKSSYFSFTHIF